MNKNHKWSEVEKTPTQKMQTCIRCDIERYWSGEYQSWNYLDLRTPIGSKRSTWFRPVCDPARKPIYGFKNHTAGYITEETK